MGIMTFLDPPRPDTKRTIERAMEHGVDVKMITGDHKVIARETARQLGMGTNILGCEGCAYTLSYTTCIYIHIYIYVCTTFTLSSSRSTSSLKLLAHGVVTQ
jgi:magnesium-transporting ATPase (P-type)